VPQNACPLGIGPVDLEVDFQPNLVYEQTFYVINSENYNIPIKMSAEGNLSQYVTFDTYDFILGPKSTPSGIHYVKATLSLPDKLEKPGSYKTLIMAIENYESGRLTTGIGAIVRIGTSITVFVPYPGKYVEFTVKIENPEVNKTIRFSADAVNRGNETINDAKAIFSIYDPEDNLIASFSSDSLQMPPSENINFIKEWFANNVRPGKYKVITRIVYDDYRAEQSKDFLIGSPTAKIINVTVHPIVEESIGRIVARVASEWNDKITGSYIILDIQKDDFHTSVKSENFELEKWEERDIEMFWDTSKSGGPGEYAGNATLYYFNGTYSINFPILVVAKGPDFNTILLIIAAIILVIIFAAYAIFYKRGSKGKIVQKKLI
jgi:hypothetical protein